MRIMSLLEHILMYIDQVMNEEQKAREFHANPVPRAVETGGRCFISLTKSTCKPAYILNFYISNT